MGISKEGTLMSRIILSVMLAMCVAVGTALLGSTITKLEAAHQRPAPADPAILGAHLQDLRGEVALP